MNLGNQLVGWFLAIGLAMTTVIGWLVLEHSPNLDPLVLTVLWINVAVMIVGLGIELGRRPYSLHLMHIVSMYLFLGAPAVFQYSRGTLGVAGSIHALTPQLLPAAASTTLWMIAYLFTYEIRKRMFARRKAAILNRSISMQRVFLLNVLAIGGLGYLGAVGLVGAGTRGAAELAMADFSSGAGAGLYQSTLYILTYNIIRSLPPLALLAALLLLLRNPRGQSLFFLPIVVVVGIGTLAANNPFAAPRMFLTCLLIAFVTPFVLRRFQTGWLIFVSILLGLAVLPALGTTRDLLELGDIASYFELISPLDYLARSSDVDSFGMVALCQKWVDLHGHRWGQQTFGVALMWIPRALWPTKRIATGSMVTADLGFDFTNLAPPVTAEPLVDFGLIGVPVFAVLFALVLARLDAVYWAIGRERLATSYRVIDVVYPFWLVCIVYVTRGDILAGVTFTLSFTIWIVLLARLTSFGATARAPALPIPTPTSARGEVDRVPR